MFLKVFVYCLLIVLILLKGEGQFLQNSIFNYSITT